MLRYYYCTSLYIVDRVGLLSQLLSINYFYRNRPKINDPKETERFDSCFKYRKRRKYTLVQLTSQLQES